MWIHLSVQSDSRSVSWDSEMVVELRRKKRRRRKVGRGGGGGGMVGWGGYGKRRVAEKESGSRDNKDWIFGFMVF